MKIRIYFTSDDSFVVIEVDERNYVMYRIVVVVVYDTDI
jgi:hypothetical protein